MSAQAIYRYVNATYSVWSQNPEYIEACRTTPRLGDPTAYTPAHPPGASPTDNTTFKVGLAGWNANNLPDIMYQLWPCQAWKASKDSAKPGPRLDAQGSPMFERYPRPGEAARPILDFPILQGVNKISTEVPFWLLEIWFRLEPRLEWKDIDMLMEHTGKRFAQPDKAKFINAKNNVSSRGRRDWYLVSWREKSKGSKANGARDDVLAALSQAQQNGNTTRGLTPGPDLQGNVIPMLATRRSRASNTASSSNALPAPAVNPSTGPSAQAQKAAPGPNKRRRVNLNEDTDDEDADDIPVAAPKPKRRRTAVTTYVVDDDSEDSAASEYGPDPAPSRSKRQRESLSEDDEVVGIPDAGSSRSRMPERQPETGRSGHRNKKQKVNDIQVEDDAGPSLHQQPHLPFGQNAQRRSDSHRQPRFVQEVRTNRLHRLPPRSTSYATTLPEPNPYTGHGGYGDTPFVNNGYLSTYGPNPLPFPGYITANVANDWTTQMAPEGFANEFGYGNVTSQLYAPAYGVNSFAPTGQMQRVQQVDDGNTSASGRVRRIANEAVQPWQDQAFNDVLVRHQQKQRRESSRSIPAVANPGHDSVEGGYRPSQTNVARSENNEVPAPIGNFPERQNDNGRNNILVEDYQAQPSRRPSDRRTDSSAPVTDMPPQAAEPQRQQVVQQSQTQTSDGQNAGRAHTNIAHPQPIRPMMSVGNPTPPTDAACEAPQQFSEADLLFHDDDLSSWPSDPALWNPEWNAFLDFHDAEPLLRAHNVDKNL